jgi:uncharacterized protein YkwD
MFLTLIVAATISQTPAWHLSSNYPGWQGYGTIKNGILDPQRWRRTDDLNVEYIRDGNPVPEGYIKIEQQTGDSLGFVAWLNGQRTSVGLSPVMWNEGMANAAAINNSYQVIYGIGHHAMAGARRQNASASMEYPALLYAWLASPGHRSALLDPTIQWVGIAFSGVYVTFSAR